MGNPDFPIKYSCMTDSNEPLSKKQFQEELMELPRSGSSW